MPDVNRDQFAIIKIEGMHCHKCEAAIRSAIQANAGVREVEVDFLSGQASVLFTRGTVSVQQLMSAVESAGYRAAGFSQSQPQ